jgi:DNA-directed RNA polymerase subunit RPC12/RpoP
LKRRGSTRSFRIELYAQTSIAPTEQIYGIRQRGQLMHGTGELTMAEYIEREAAITTCKTFWHNNLHNALEAFRQTQAADVQPVRHGRWINHGWNTVCSECGEDYAFAKRNYCPNCGAKMDLKEDDKDGRH